MHSPEKQFELRVREWARAIGTVKTQYYCERSQRIADLIVSTRSHHIAIEVESHFEGALKGVSQAAIYAESVRDVTKPIHPLVVVPTGHVEEPERTMIETRTNVPIRDAGELGFPDSDIDL